MNVVDNVGDRMVNDSMGVPRIKAAVTFPSVGVKVTALRDVSLHQTLKVGFIHARNDDGSDFSTALQHAHNDGFVGVALSDAASLSNMLVHVLRKTADTRLVCFYVVNQLLHCAVLHRKANPVKDEPCALLSDPKRAM